MSPAYYVGREGRDVFDVAEEFDLGRYRTAALKYMVRAGRKVPGVEGTVSDLRKLVDVIEREIAVLEGRR